MFEHILFGGDVSHFQYQDGFSIPDSWVFGYGKVTEGSHTVDTSYPHFKDQAKRRGILWACYHFLHSDSSPVTQAKFVMATEPDKRIPIIVDVELSGSSKPGMPHAKAFVETVRNAGRRVGAGYYPRWWWDRTGQPNLSALRVPIIASGYPSKNPGGFHDLYKHVTDSYWAPYGQVTPSILQFSDHGSFAGNGGAVDLDAFRGSRKELAKLGIFHDFGAPSHKSRKPLQVQIDRLRHRITALEKGSK